MLVTSSNKYSEPHSFIYTPKNAFGAGALAMATSLASLQHVKNAQGILWVFIQFFSTNKTLENPPKQFAAEIVKF